MSYRGIISLMPKTIPFTASYYKADGNALDSQYINNGTLTNGATYGTGIINQGFSLDGVNDYVSMGNNLDFNGSTPFSLSAWVNPSDVNSFRIIIAKLNGGSPFEGYSLQIANGSIRLFMCSNYNTNDYLDVKTIDSISSGVFSHICMTYDGSKNASNIKIYINGVDKALTTSFNNLSGSISNSYIFTLGSNNGTNAFYQGIIDEVGVIDKVLTPTEVTNLYNGGLGKQSIP